MAALCQECLKKCSLDNCIQEFGLVSLQVREKQVKVHLTRRRV